MNLYMDQPSKTLRYIFSISSCLNIYMKCLFIFVVALFTLLNSCLVWMAALQARTQDSAWSGALRMLFGVKRAKIF